MDETNTQPGSASQDLGATEATQAQDAGAIDVDQLIADVESGATERGQQAQAQTQSQAQAQAQQQQQQQAQQIAQEIEFTHNGKAIKAPWDKAKLWASQGYDYAQKMASFNKERQDFQKAQKEFEPLKSRYTQVDEFAKSNPEWWKFVEQQYLQATGQIQGQQPQGMPQDIQLQNLINQKLQPVQEYIEQAKAREVEAQRQAEDQGLDSEIQSMRDQFKHLDWTTPDEQGRDMLARVLEHAVNNGIKNFRDAFLILNHDRLIQLAKEESKENLVRAKQDQAKRGLLGQTQAPTKALNRPRNLKTTSYDELTREALQELGIA